MVDLKAFRGEVILVQFVQPVMLATGSSGAVQAAAQSDGRPGSTPQFLMTPYLVGEVGVDEEKGAFVVYQDPGERSMRCKAYISDENIASVGTANGLMAAPSGLIVP